MATKALIRQDFTEGKLLKKMFFFAIPMILSTLLQLLFNAADVAVVGKFAGTVYQSAVGATSSTIHLLVNLLMGISIGANVAMATAYGAKDLEKQERIVHTSMALAIVGGVTIMFVGVFVARPVMIMLKTPSDVLPYAVLYMQIYFLGAPANIVYNFGASIFRAVGETKKPLLYLFVSGIINVVINVITVVFFNMHVVGVAVGTVVSQYVAAVWVVADLMKETGGAKYTLKKTKFHKKELLKILFLGVPTGISSCCFSLSNLLIQSTINSYGSVVMAGNTIAVNIDGFIDSFGASYGRTTITVIGQNIGAKKPERMRKIIGAGMLLCVLSDLTCALFMLLFGEWIYGLYNSDIDVISVALTRMTYTSVLYSLVALLEIFGSALRGMGYSMTPMFVNLICTCLFRVVWILGFYPLNPCYEMVLLSYPISWILSGLVQTALYFLFESKFMQKFQTAENEN